MSPFPREYYDAITGGGLGAENYMWTGAIDIIIENELAGQRVVADVLHSALDCPALRLESAMMQRVGPDPL